MTSIINSTFSKNVALKNGQIIDVRSNNTQVTMKDSIFTQNKAHTAGVAMVQNLAKINVTNCTIENNVAVRSGVFHVIDDAMIEISKTKIINN